jgi:hypothetical protein
MSTPERASRWLAAIFICALFPTIASSQAEHHQLSCAECQMPTSILALMPSLENWLDTESRYPRRTDQVRLKLIRPAEAMLSSGRIDYSNSMGRGYYDAQSLTIYLVKPWSPDNPHDVSVLLHELVHHRQQIARNWECPNAQEFPAYRLQDKWLADHGLKAQVNWLAVLIESSCRARDIHQGH